MSTTKSRVSVLVILSALVLSLLTACTGGDIIGAARGWTPVSVENGIVYVASRDGNVLALDSAALDRDEGALPVWEFRPPKSDDVDQSLGSVFSPPAIGPDLVYAAGSLEDESRGRIVALRKDRSSSNRIEDNEWEKVLGGGIVSGVTLSGQTVLVGSDDGHMYALNADNGEQIWAFPTEGFRDGETEERQIWSTPTVADGVVYFGALDDYIYAVSLTDGQLVWNYKAGGSVVTKPLVVGDLVIFGSFDRKLYAINRNNAQVVWTFESDNWFWSGPVTDGSNVYAPSTDGKVYALPINRRTGDAPLWSLDLGEAITSTPFLAERRLVVATENGIISLLNTQASGSVETVPVEANKSVRAPLAGEGPQASPRVYFGDGDGVVRSLDVERWRIRWTFSTRVD
jgi:outer membrane protein assembly factor BamB